MTTRPLLGHTVAVITAASVALAPPLAIAGDLNAEVNTMFNNLGAIGNYTAPGAFRGQTFNTYSGGSLYLRSPNRTYQLAAIQFPSARGGCGGIDVFGGSFSHISAAEFKNMLRNITSALPGIAFQLALESVSPMLGGLTKWGKGLETWINNARINSCETAKALVSTVAEQMGYDAQESCAKLAVQQGLESDVEAARRRCASDRPGVLASARTSTDPAIRQQAPAVGNLVWQALKKVDTIDDANRELLMSMVGAVIFYPDEAGRDADMIAPTITTAAHLLYGQSDDVSGTIRIRLLKCNNYVDCDVVTPADVQHTPFPKLVENLMRSISDKIASRTPIPNDSPEVGFVNRTSEPVWRMMSVGNTLPGSMLAETMIMEYREIIAADYAYTFLNQNLRIALSAVDKVWTLNVPQQTALNGIRNRGHTLLTLLAHEKTVLYAKSQSATSVAVRLEQLERELRSHIPAHVIDMLGHSALLSR
jgi:conjugative transfer pilus assembly protein TraH